MSTLGEISLKTVRWISDAILCRALWYLGNNKHTHKFAWTGPPYFLSSHHSHPTRPQAANSALYITLNQTNPSCSPFGQLSKQFSNVLRLDIIMASNDTNRGPKFIPTNCDKYLFSDLGACLKIINCVFLIGCTERLLRKGQYCSTCYNIESQGFLGTWNWSSLRALRMLWLIPVWTYLCNYYYEISLGIIYVYVLEGTLFGRLIRSIFPTSLLSGGYIVAVNIILWLICNKRGVVCSIDVMIKTKDGLLNVTENMFRRFTFSLNEFSWMW